MGKRRARSKRRRSGGGGGGSKRPRDKEGETEEDYCFACKDGGLLRFCDYRNCHKAYHPECVGKDNDFLDSDEQFICDWHICFICKGRSYYRCFCCPGNSICRGCVGQAEFVQVMLQTKGFCNNCLKMAIMIEKNVDVDSDGERVDFSDRETYEFLFKEYWEIIKEKEGLTLDNLQEARDFLKRGLTCNQVSDSENADEELSSDANEELSSDDDFLGNSDDGDDEPTYQSDLNRTSNKVKAFMKEGKSKKNAYVSWGSKELIGFFLSIGKDTSKSLDRFGAAEVVKEYIRQKDLLQKDKKKHVMCDDKLQSLFRKSKLKYNKICSLLERHIAANITSEDETSASSEDNNDSIMKNKTRIVNSESSTPKGVSERYKRCFSSLVRDNIKLIYLRRTLVMDLLKQPATFESKVIGCFVRVKNDLRDYSYHKPQKLYQLGQVTGIRRSSEEYKIRDISTDILLCVSNMWSEVKISMLSDEDFEEEECEYLRLLAQKEPSKRHTVAELEDKMRSVHGDIVSHWIDKELQRLEKLIEMANEKGWRNEMHEYIDKRQLLRTPSERRRLLEEVPQVIPDIEDSKDTEFVVATADKSFQKTRAAFQGAYGERAVCLESCLEEKSKGANGKGAVCLKSCPEEKSEATKADAGDDTPGTSVQKQGTAATKAKAAGDTPGAHVQKQVTEAAKDAAAGDAPEMHVQKQGTEANAAGTSTQVITIDDDEDGPVHDKGKDLIVVDLDGDKSGDLPMVQHETKYMLCSGQKAARVKGVISESTGLWYYMDPQGDEQGPFTMELLRHWNKAGWFDNDFRVWRAGQSSDSAILLRDALLLTT